MSFDDPLSPSRPSFFRFFFLHDRTEPLLSILLVSLFGDPFDSGQTDGWLDFLFLHLTDSGVLTFDDTLVFNDCMEWVNIPRWGGYRLGWDGQKDSFSFTWAHWCYQSGH